MITLKSYGFKFGRPEANVVFDASYFKNPWRDEAIRSSAFKKDKVLKFMLEQEGVHEFCEKVRDLIMEYNKLFPDENIQVAVCCSAGEYRSPAIVELVAKMLPTGFPLIIKHGDNSKI